MTEEKIELRMENGRSVTAVVLSKSTDALWVVIGEGLHNVKCKLMPTRNGLAYSGSLMGRELIYECSVKQLQADLVKQQQEQEQHRYRPRPR